MRKIRIVVMPPGLVEESIRMAWIGVVLPTLSDSEASRAEKILDPRGQNRGGYVVNGCDAINALRKARRQEAVEFWSRGNVPQYIRFAKNCCQLV